jgi:outer membrane protein assembly factor BamB
MPVDADGTRPGDLEVTWFGVDGDPGRTTRTPSDHPRRRRPGWATTGVAALAALAIAVAVAWPSGDGAPARPDVAPLGAAVESRLPAEPVPAWETSLRGTGLAKSTDIAVHGDTVVAIVDDGSPNRAAVAVLDARDGLVRWRRGLGYAPEELRVLGVVGDVVVVQQADLGGRRRAVAFDAGDGTTRWEDRVDAGRYEVLLGTGVVTRLDAARSGTAGADRPGARRDGTISFLDPATGDSLGELEGSIASTDLDGRWAFWRGSQLVAADLTEAAPPTFDAVADAGFTTGDAVLIDGGAVALGPGGTLRRLSIGTEPTRLDLDVPPAEGLVPAGGGWFVVVADGEIVGVADVDGELQPTWRVSGTVEAVVPAPTGVVVVARLAGADDRLADTHVVLDGLTGDEVGRVAVPRGDEIDTIVATDGHAVRRRTPSGSELSAFDDDGTPRWSLPVEGRVVVGDGLVVTLRSTPGAYVVAGLGEG